MDFDDLMEKIKKIEQRIILYNASSAYHCQNNQLSYDPFYFVYCNFRLLRLKHEYQIFRQSYKLSEAFSAFIGSLSELQVAMYPNNPSEGLLDVLGGLSLKKYKSQRESNIHLETEIAFGYQN